MNVLRDPSLTVVLSEYAVLSEIPVALLAPDRIGELWTTSSCAVTDVINLFSGERSISTRIGASDEMVAVPKASAEVVVTGISAAIEQGLLWFQIGDVSIWHETAPDGVVVGDGRLSAAPPAIDPQRLSAKNLPGAWELEQTTPEKLLRELRMTSNSQYPWPLVRNAINAAIQLNLIRETRESKHWAGDIADTGVVFSSVSPVITQPGLFGGRPVVTEGSSLWAESALSISELQDLSDVIPLLNSAVVSIEGNLSITVRVTVNSATRSLTSGDAAKLSEALGSVSSKLLFKR